MIIELKEHYSHLFEDALINEIAQVGTYKEVPAGNVLMNFGDYIKVMPLLISGAIKVMREGYDGGELLLYYLEKGDTCSVSMTCCMGDKKSEVRAITEVDSILIMIPVNKMEDWAGKYKSWRRFLFNSYHNRINELFNTVDSIAFNKMDERLIHYLKEKTRITNSSIINSTHQNIAYDLHTSRVVVSRLLKKLEQVGAIELHRNHIKIIDLEASVT